MTRRGKLVVGVAGFAIVGWALWLYNAPPARTRLLVSTSPDRRSTVVVEEGYGGWSLDSHSIGFTYITLTTPQGPVILRDEGYGETRPRFVVAAWSADSTRLGILQCSIFESPDALAYDLSTEARIPVDEMLLQLERAVIDDYFGGVQPAGDQCSPFCWICSEQAAALFQNRRIGQAPPRSGSAVGAIPPRWSEFCQKPRPCALWQGAATE